MGWDPGRHNCAYAIYGQKGVEDSDVIDGVGKDIEANLAAFAERVERILDWFGPDACAVERYQLRGGKGFIGNMEAVNIMIGVIAAACRAKNIPCKLVTPSVHKTWAGTKKGATKGKGGKLDMTTDPEFVDLETDHEADAANVARYGREKIQWLE
jgi:Holliday junction resolvasome RuvABC endonuclease subunit